MKNDIDLIDFWRILWKGKFFIIFLSFIFLCIGVIANYYYKPIINYKSSITIKELPSSKLIPLVKINEAVKSIVDHHIFVFDKIDRNLLDSNLSYYMENISNSPQLLMDFLYELESIEKKIKGLIEIKYIEKGDMTTEEYNIKLKDIATSDDFVIKKIHNRIVIEKNSKSENGKLKNEEYLHRIIVNANTNVNEILKNVIEEIIKELEDKIEIEEKKIYDEIELFTELQFNKETKAIINEHLKNKNLLAISMLINEYYSKNITSEDLKENLDMKKLNYLKQKIFYIKSNRTKFLIKNLKKIYYLSGVNDLKFQTMTYDLSSIKTIKKIAYKPNYPLIGFLLGLFISIVLLIIKFSFMDFKQNKAI